MVRFVQINFYGCTAVSKLNLSNMKKNPFLLVFVLCGFGFRTKETRIGI